MIITRGCSFFENTIKYTCTCMYTILYFNKYIILLWQSLFQTPAFYSDIRSISGLFRAFKYMYSTAQKQANHRMCFKRRANVFAFGTKRVCVCVGIQTQTQLNAFVKLISRSHFKIILHNRRLKQSRLLCRTFTFAFLCICVIFPVGTWKQAFSKD